MIKQIIDGLSNKLYEVFGDGYEIYADEDIKQGLEEPCFFISVVSASRDRQVGSRWKASTSFDILYFPKVASNNVEMHTVADSLFNNFEIVELLDGDLIRGVNMKYEITDGILHFFVNYNLFLASNFKESEMEEIKSKVGIERG